MAKPCQSHPSRTNLGPPSRQEPQKVPTAGHGVMQIIALPEQLRLPRASSVSTSTALPQKLPQSPAHKVTTCPTFCAGNSISPTCILNQVVLVTPSAHTGTLPQRPAAIDKAVAMLSRSNPCNEAESRVLTCAIQSLLSNCKQVALCRK